MDKPEQDEKERAEITILEKIETLPLDNNENKTKEKGVMSMEMEEMKDDELLRYVASEVVGAFAVGIVGMDGIPIAVYTTVPDFDPNAIQTENASFLIYAKKIASNANLGNIKEVMISFDNHITIFRMIGDDYFTGICIENGGNIGKARLLQQKLAKIMYTRYYGKEKKQ